MKKMETCSSASTSDWGMSYQTTHMSSVLSRISIGKRMPNQRMSISRRHACPHADEGGPSQSRCAFDSSSAIGAPAVTGTTGTSATPPAIAPADESEARPRAAPPLDAASSAASARSSAASSAASLATSATSANV